jgi:hypothetical protein
MAILFLAACGPYQTGPKSSVPLSTKKGTPKLDSQLIQLSAAQEKGDETSFAQQANINIDNGRIRVVIECMTGQVDAASKAAIDSGAVVETAYDNLIQVSIPIVSLIGLSNAESVKFIRLPLQPLPGQNK